MSSIVGKHSTLCHRLYTLEKKHIAQIVQLCVTILVLNAYRKRTYCAHYAYCKISMNSMVV